MDYNTRAYRFVRATEVRPFTKEHKHAYISSIESMLTQCDILSKAQPKNVSDKILIIETMYKFMMEYPEVLANYPPYRNIVIDKMYELENEMAQRTGEKSLVFNDVKYYMKMLSARPDYVETTVHNEFIKPCIETPSHSYNLRVRNPNVQYVF